MMSEVKSSVMLEIKRGIKASVEDVFRAWTDPAELKQWFAAGPNYTPAVAEVDLVVGGKYRMGMRNEQGELHVATGEFREILPDKKLAYTWSWEGPEPGEETLVTIELQEVEGGTELLLRHEKFAEESARDAHLEGWEGCFDQLQAYFSSN